MKTPVTWDVMPHYLYHIHSTRIGYHNTRVKFSCSCDDIFGPVIGPLPGPIVPNRAALDWQSSSGGQYIATGSDFVVEMNADSSDPSGHRGIKITYQLIYPGAWINKNKSFLKSMLVDMQQPAC